jgi:tRNA(Ile)-lysidine synthase
MRRVTRDLRRRCGVGEGDRLLVAVSGGGDSVALFRALRLLMPRRRWRLELHVAHIHHALRTPDSDHDAEFVEALAKQFGVPFHRRDVRLHDPERNVEAQARALRYHALREIAEGERCTRIATAHHSDDQLETLLLALVRGRSLRRMRGMAWRRPIEAGSCVGLIRPMLNVTRDEALDFLAALKQGWREDHSNEDPSRARNRVRRDVVPVLRELNPEVPRAAADFADRLRHRLGGEP